jgi:hypothetical protein
MNSIITITELADPSYFSQRSNRSQIQNQINEHSIPSPRSTPKPTTQRDCSIREKSIPKLPLLKNLSTTTAQTVKLVSKP